MAAVWVKPAAVALVLAATFAAGWAVNGWRLEKDFQTERLDNQRLAAKVLTQRTEQRDKAQADLQAERDRNATEAKGHQDETNRLRADVASRDRRLRIRATCTTGLPSTGAASGVGAGGTAELDSDAQRAYFAHRVAIDYARAQTLACQTELRKWAGLPPAGQPAGQ